MSTATPSTSLFDACPSWEQLQGFVQRQLPDADTLLIRSHLKDCTQCTLLVRVLQSHVAAPSETSSSPTVLGLAPESDETPTQPALENSLVAPPQLGRYTLRKVLGFGGFGVVYLAEDTELGRRVAVKLPSSGTLSRLDLTRFREEARAHAALDHPHIVPIYDVGREENAPFFLVSKLIEGQDLSRRISKGPLAADEAARIVGCIAEALAHVHARNLLHRDVKPKNILIENNGTPYLTDFGLVAPLGPETLPEDRFVGTPPYMSPEQVRGEGPRADGRSDIYSLGVVLYEALTGTRPFHGDLIQLRQKIRSESPLAPRELVSTIPLDLERICQKAMARDPEQRYARAAEMAEDLALVRAGEPPRHARKVGHGEASWRWLRRWQRVLIPSTIAVLLGLVLLVLLLRWPRQERILVTVSTEPPGSRISYFPLDPIHGRPLPQEVVRGRDGEAVQLVPGEYLVVAVHEDDKDRFHEVFRYVPGPTRGDFPNQPRMGGASPQESYQYREGVCHLRPITLHTSQAAAGMARLEGSDTFLMGSADDPVSDPRQGVVSVPHKVRVPPFLLDTTEVTREAYQKKIEKATEKPPPEKGDHAAINIRWDQAVAYAEKIGKRLPDEAEYECAATRGGTQRFPWGNTPPPLGPGGWILGPVGQPDFDRLETPGQPHVYGLYSNAAEWTASWPGQLPRGLEGDPQRAVRVLRGAPLGVIHGELSLREPPRGPRERIGQAIPVPAPGLGFRCARSIRPRWVAEDFITFLGR